MTDYEVSKKSDLARLRRLAITSQALNGKAPFGRGPRAALRAVEHLGYVQIDTISVVERAHHHVWHSRVPNYRPGWLDELLGSGAIFEYWSHAAAFLPMRDYRFSQPQKQAIRSGKVRWRRNPDRKLMGRILARIRTDGALRSRDVEDQRTSHTGWWDWKPAKQALDQLFMEGRLMVAGRDGFQKVYDLPERVLPSDIDTTTPSIAEQAAHLLDQQLSAHGLVTQKGITYLRRNAPLRAAVQRALEKRAASGELDTLRPPSGERFYVRPGALDGRLAGARSLRILSPFDSFIIQRDRLLSLFGFDYQIECYVPAPKRRFGYFCLPLLLGDALVGRIDCKAHRKDARLEIRTVHFESGSNDPETLATKLGEALREFMAFQSCTALTIRGRCPKGLRTPIERAAMS